MNEHVTDEANESNSERRPLLNGGITEGKPKGFPKHIVFILGNEFCERYSYYGMRTILVLYLTYYMNWDANTSTAIYHAFTVVAYFFPLLGAILADTWWGKYRTILWLSVVYAVGMVLNTLGAVGPLGDHTTHAVLSCVGLVVIAIGTGGIKPCVSAFGGDQFEADQENYRRRFFSLFYFAINAGSLISTFASPLIREQVKCFGYDCYSLAFGIPAVLMAVAILFFVLGTRYYRRVMPSDRIFLRAAVCVWHAWKNRWNTPRKERNRDHWMDYANDGTYAQTRLIRDIKYVLRILILYIPLPLFWTLFDQQGSRWTLQAVRMDGYVGSLWILPDQMQLCNPLFIVTLIPLFEVTLYPCLRHLNFNFTQLRRMALGMILAGLSFVVAALVQMKINVNLTQYPDNAQQTSLRVINACNCTVSLTTDLHWNHVLKGSSNELIIPPGNATNTKEQIMRPGNHQLSYYCHDDPTKVSNQSVDLLGKEAMDYYITKNSSSSFRAYLSSHPTKKSSGGLAWIGVFNALNEDIEIYLKEKGIYTTVQRGERFKLTAIVKGSHQLLVRKGAVEWKFKYKVGTGGLYTIVLRQIDPVKHITQKSDITMDFYTDIYQNDVSIFWMIPQYFIITVGEVFLSVTGLEFSYSQAPPSMKSILQAFWLLTVSLGDVVVLIVAEARLIPNQADEYFLFAGLIAIASVLFIFLSVRYEYVDETKFAEVDEDQLSEHKTDGFISENAEDPDFLAS